MTDRLSTSLRVSTFALAAALLPAAAHAQVSSTEQAHRDYCQAHPGDPTCPELSNVKPDLPVEGAVNADGSVVRPVEGNEVTVTGSRIRLPNLQNLEPTLTVNRQYLQDRNLTSLGDALNELPVFRGSVTPNGAQGSFGQGVNFVNGFGLGSNRTLTLVNGRRFVSSNPPTLFNQGSAGTQVDLNTIPTILIDRVDNIDIGGAPVYGSDAIAGAVNIILRDRYKGFTADILSGITEQGDGFRWNASFLAGHDYLDGRANITIAYSHDDQKGVLYNDRDFLRANAGGATNPSTLQASGMPAIGSAGRAGTGITPLNDGRINTGFGYNDSTTDGNPGTIQVKDLSIYYLTQGGLLTSTTGNTGAAYNYQFDGSGNLVPYSRGIPFVGINASGGDGFRFNDYSQITSQVRRDTANVFAHFDASDALRLFFEGEYFHSIGDQLIRQPTFNSNLFSGSSGPLTFTSSSPFLTAQAKQQLAALGVTRFQVSRASIDLADLSGGTETNLGRAVVGARGDFKIGSRSFNYEVTGNYGRNVLKDTSQDLNRQRFINAVNVTTNSAGQIVCNATPTVQAVGGGTPVADPNCVPLNLLGFGQASPAARAYVISTNSSYSVIEQKVFDANVGGSPFDLFGNQQAFNVGYEHREENASFTPSNFQQLGLGRSAAITPISGGYKVNEVFGEALIQPVSRLNNLWYLQGLQLFARGRYVDNSINGGFFSWAAGGRIQLIKDIAFRGNYTKSFRAPAVTELFLPVSPGFFTVPDLCSPGNRNAGAAPVTRARNCAAFLAAFPNATPLDAASATVPGLSGGNLGLKNEVARSFTYGVLVTPRFIPGLSISADYLSIDIANPIANLTVAQIASACFDNDNFNAADPANGNAFCSQIRRYTAANAAGGTAANGGSRAGQVINDPADPGVISGFVNGKRVYFSGIQGQVDYTTGLSRFGIPGAFSASSAILYVRRRLVDITGVAPLRTDGTYVNQTDPKFQAQVNLRYVNDIWGVSTSVNVIGKQIATRAATGFDLREFDTIPAFAQVNGSLFLNVNQRFRWTLSVTNIGNRVGYRYFGYVVNPATFGSDLLGRRFVLSARLTY